MAESIVVNMSSNRYFCHKCSQEISPVLPDFVCPHCRAGFIEELTTDPEADDSASDIIWQDSLDRDSHSEDVFELPFPNSRGSSLAANSSSDSSQDGGTPRSTSFSNREAGTSTQRNRLDSIRRRFPNLPDGSIDASEPGNPRFLQLRIGDQENSQAIAGIFRNFFSNFERPGQQMAYFNTFNNGPSGSSRSGGNRGRQLIDLPLIQVLYGNPGDYAWGSTGLDAVISHLLNSIEVTGPPPMSKEEIERLPTVNITQDDVNKNLQCTVCMEDYKLDEPVRKLSCTHVYHNGCIIPWLEMHGTCPICRKLLNTNDSSQNFDMPNGSTSNTRPEQSTSREW